MTFDSMRKISCYEVHTHQVHTQTNTISHRKVFSSLKKVCNLLACGEGKLTYCNSMLPLKFSIILEMCWLFWGKKRRKLIISIHNIIFIGP